MAVMWSLILRSVSRLGSVLFVGPVSLTTLTSLPHLPMGRSLLRLALAGSRIESRRGWGTPPSLRQSGCALCTSALVELGTRLRCLRETTLRGWGPHIFAVLTTGPQFASLGARRL